MFVCPKGARAQHYLVTSFTTTDSFLVLPSLGSTKTSSISFKIRTNEPNGLLMYSSGASTSHVSDDVMMVW
uniref:Uncharacterized protein n=2 Tax=Timema TaxID=61471 RepID=A0A7R9E0F2_9NEOP|nr:unnamed protein product [Timema monikensis]